MDKAPEFTLELSADRSNVKDVVKGIMHTIFFHRFFTPLTPATHDVLDTTLPYVSEDDIEDLIETRATAFVRSLNTASSTHTSPQYSAKSAKADEETVWETWRIEVTLTSARSEPEAARNRRAMESSLQKAAMKVVTTVNEQRSHIPPITTNESNPFPYQILVNKNV